MKDDKWLYFWIYYVQGSIGIVSELKKLIVYFHNHVPESLHECLYIPVVVGMGRGYLGSQVADIGSWMLRMSLLAFNSHSKICISENQKMNTAQVWEPMKDVCYLSL